MGTKKTLAQDGNPARGNAFLGQSARYGSIEWTSDTLKQMSTEEILDEILRLPRSERARVVEELLSSLEDPAEDVADASASELERRSRGKSL